MSFYDEYPYQDNHELNLDWIIKKVQDTLKVTDSFMALNSIKWLGNWNISNDYERWSLVDNGSGDGYISLQPVPAGIALTNTSYWVKIYQYNGVYTAFNTRITALETQNGSATLTTTAQTLSDAINELDSDISNIWNTIYPVGSYYISTSTSSPASLFGGTWLQIENKFLLGASSTHTLNSTGGSETVTLTTAQMPSHKHDVLDGQVNVKIAGPYSASGGSSYKRIDSNTLTNQDTLITSNVGGGKAHDNMPPYIAVNIWQRTA